MEALILAFITVLSAYMVYLEHWKEDMTTFIFIVSINLFMVFGLFFTKEQIYPFLCIFVLLMFGRSFREKVNIVLKRIF